MNDGLDEEVLLNGVRGRQILRRVIFSYGGGGYMKDKVYAKCPKTINQLKSYISAEMASISTDLCETVCRSVPHRLRECIVNEGKQFEYLRWSLIYILTFLL